VHQDGNPKVPAAPQIKKGVQQTDYGKEYDARYALIGMTESKQNRIDDARHDPPAVFMSENLFYGIHQIAAEDQLFPEGGKSPNNQKSEDESRDISSQHIELIPIHGLSGQACDDGHGDDDNEIDGNKASHSQKYGFGPILGFFKPEFVPVTPAEPQNQADEAQSQKDAQKSQQNTLDFGSPPQQ
jgi:hypothetical protein